MFENVVGFFKKLLKKEDEEDNNKDVAKERLHLVLMQDRACLLYTSDAADD